MRVVGLISGGKDSVWNLHYCRHFGHELVCVANLAPPAGIDELDSYMYQTVGSDMINAIATALGLPLVRRVITGQPKATSSNTYAPEEGDEVEDLTLLLEEVLRAHPGVQAVSCGAILSNYQRLRVENVCARLGLKVLAFMWRQPQELLLQQMIDSGMDARIAKVASMGLKPKHVGESILNPAFAEHLSRLGAKWGVHVCGEGGEYETTVVDAPLYLHPVTILASQTLAHPDGGDDVAFLQVTETAAGPERPSGPQLPPYAVLAGYPSLRHYEQDFPRLQRQPWPCVTLPPCGLPPVSASSSASPYLPLSLPRLGQVGSILATSSLDAATLNLATDTDAATQCEALLAAAETWLRREHGRSLHDAIFAEVQVLDLACFEAVNAAYARHLGSSPPPRVCIETPLPEGLQLRLRLLLQPEGQEVETLRVQSISTWAMACIGPYSQALRLGSLLLTSGVLGLIPHSMMLPSTEEAVAAAADGDGNGDAEGRAPRQWEAELWLLMRSLRNVLEVMSSSFGEARLAHVFVAGTEIDLHEVSDHVLAYMHRDAVGAAPIIIASQMPRLPKDGCVEVSLVCCSGDVSSSPPAACTSSPDGLPGILRTQTWQAAAVRISIAEFALDGEIFDEDFLEKAVESCIQAALPPPKAGSGSECATPGYSLQLQCAVPGADPPVAAAAQAALQRLGLLDICVLAQMPALSLGPQTILRVIALQA